MKPSFVLRRTALTHHRLCLPNPRTVPRYFGKQFSTTNSRQFEPTSNPPSVALAVSLLFGLPPALWAYKCLLMILLQRKLIYMGYAPPGAREEDPTAYADLLHGIELKEVKLRNIDHSCTLHGIVLCHSEARSEFLKQPRIIIIYLQGNAGNPLHRIPMFKVLLNACSDLNPAIVAVAPRSFWKSSRRTPTEAGLLSDYRHVVEFARTRWPSSPVFLYGHSLGANVATCLMSQMADVDKQGIQGLILENPFSSIPAMVEVLYDSRWLPYHYLGRFVWDKWDALRATNEVLNTSVLGRLLREDRLLILQSEKDEVVPLWMGAQICRAGNIGSPIVISGALHENAWESRNWGIIIRKFLQEMLKRANDVL